MELGAKRVWDADFRFTYVAIHVRKKRILNQGAVKRTFVFTHLVMEAAASFFLKGGGCSEGKGYVSD